MKFIKFRITFLLLTILSVSILLTTNSCSKKTDTTKIPSFNNGDIIFHTSKSRQSEAIQKVTKSEFSHVGIIYKTEKGKFYVYEAVQPVKLTKLDKWIRNGLDGKYAVKRLKKASFLLTTENLKKLKKEGEKYKGKNYDIMFNWSDKEIYCSELIWKMYKKSLNIEIGKLQKFKDFDMSDPAAQRIKQARYGDKLPLDEVVITPVSMYESDLLELVYSNY